MNKAGWLFNMIMSADGIVISLLKLFTIGIMWHNTTSTLIFGIWRFNVGFSIGYDAENNIKNHGIS